MSSVEDLFRKLPGIPIDSKDVHIIHSPSDFYQCLIDHAENAKSRIAISSLYLGDGKLENQFVDAIKENLNINSKLNVKFLLDFLRGTRGQREEKSSTTLLKKIADRAEVFLYHSPDLRGFMKKVLPERTNEIIGLQHMKLYIFDDNVLISGANLSDSYFTNRQDRYILFKNKELADFFSRIIEVVGQCSFKLQADGAVELNPECHVHPLTGSYSEYTKMMRDRINEVVNTLKIVPSDSDTVIYPLIQMGPFDLNQELDFLKEVFSLNSEDICLTMASGYFNTTIEYEDLIFGKGLYKMNIITAAPEANGFFGANGMSKYIPSMYSCISKNFIEQAKNHTRDITLYEYKRENWTFHAKGLWVETPKFTATIVGSSNYGYRSVHRDLEAQVLLVTSNQSLRSKLREEHSLISNFTSVLDVAALRRAEHHVPTIVKTISKMAFLAAMVAAKSLMDKAARNARPAQIVRTSASVTSIQNFCQPRRRVLKSGKSQNPFARNEMIKRMGGCGVRNFCTKTDDNSILEELKSENWNAVYRYPGVRFAVMLARAKLIQTVASVFYLPYSTFQYSLGNADPTWYYTTAGLAIAAPLFLILFSRYLNRLVGVISMNDNNEFIRIGYLTFWGSRKNKYVEVNEVLPLSEVSSSKSDALVKFTWYGSDNYLYLPIKHAEIVDEERAYLLFGDLSIFDSNKKMM